MNRLCAWGLPHPHPTPHRLSQDFVKRELLIVLEHGDCDSGNCLRAISVTLGDTHVQLRDSGSLSSQSTYLPGLLLPAALWSVAQAPGASFHPTWQTWALTNTFSPHCPEDPEPKISPQTQLPPHSAASEADKILWRVSKASSAPALGGNTIRIVLRDLKAPKA